MRLHIIIPMFKYLARAAAIIFFLLGFVGTVYLVRILYGAYEQSGMQKQWHQIPSPNEKLVTLKAGDAGEIVAEGTDGGLYQFTAYPEPAWINARETENVNSGATCKPISDSTYKSERMPGKVKATASVDCGFAEQAIYWDVNLLESGETWYLEKTSNSYATLGLFLLLPIGAIIDIALYVTSLFFLALDIIITFRRKAKQAISQKT